MYSVLFSKIDIGFPYVVDKLKEIMNPNSKVVIIPWSFPTETNAIGLENYFSKTYYYLCTVKQNNIRL